MNEVWVTELPADLPAGVVVLDVREPDEYAAGHVDGSIHVPLGELPTRLGELPAGPMLVVCRVGARSARACAWLDRQGYDVTNLAGGLLAWDRAGRPLLDEAGSPGQAI